MSGLDVQMGARRRRRKVRRPTRAQIPVRCLLFVHSDVPVFLQAQKGGYIMKVINIDIEDLEYDEASAQFEGHVALMIAEPNKARTVELHFISRVSQPRSCPGAIVTYSLIADALRQARRMPGFRRGEEEIEIVAPSPRIAALPGRIGRASARQRAAARGGSGRRDGARL